MTNQFTYSEGASFSGVSFWLGLVVIVFSITLMINSADTISFIFSILGIIIGAVLFLSIKGIKFNLDEKKAYRFSNLILTRVTYDVIDLSAFDSVELSLFSEAQTMNMKSITTTVRTKVFEIYMRSGKAKKVLILETTDYKRAKEILAKLTDSLNITSKNRYEQRRHQAMESRKVRGKR